MTIYNLVEKAYSNALEKGFHDKEQSVGEMLMLIVSELGEALEAHRIDKRAKLSVSTTFQQDDFEMFVKDSFEDELADVVIRVADLCGHMGIDLQRHIELKMEFNKSRERLHGKAY